jgi:hypothetical protein
MKFSIETLICTNSDGAFGNATGTIELDVVPQIGDTISFAFPKAKGLARVVGFTGMLWVKDRVLNAGGGSNVSLALEDLLVGTLKEARAVAEYLEKGFGLSVDTY